MGIVRFALRFPHTFYVVAALILSLGVAAIRSMPTDIFPEINIPVMTVIWQYTGLTTPEMEQRVTPGGPPTNGAALPLSTAEITPPGAIQPVITELGDTISLEEQVSHAGSIGRSATPGVDLVREDVPRLVYFSERLPHTPTGKVQKFMLRENRRSENGV